MEPSHNSHKTYPCPHCQTGSLRLMRVVFARWQAGLFVTIPNFPAWVCDVCGEREYDAVALEQVKLLLGPAADLPAAAGRRAWRSMPNFDPEPQNGSRRPI